MVLLYSQQLEFTRKDSQSHEQSRIYAPSSIETVPRIQLPRELVAAR
jgi:hypothetical protein